MKITTILIIALLLYGLNLNGQTRNITGRVITDLLEPLPMLDIRSSDSLLLGKTDMDGHFKLTIPQYIDSLLFRYVGMEPTDIKLKKNCNTIELIMMYDGTYDFMTLKKVDRLRRKKFDKLPLIHLKAVENGLFKSNNICYKRVFEELNPPKAVRDSIKREYKLKRKQNRLIFKKLEIDNVVKVPSATWSVYTNETDFGCLITGKVIGKNKKNADYNLLIKVTDNICDNKIATYNGQPVKIGDTITHNMKYFKIVKE
ncbi:hypothetical protein [Yeosuana marina]|uniref:hypothetical protein n=1 Tax=Yeosuana marina TaxID=1565536 RepID=UPI001423619C|nr:hypothetical protein [Yeosuana marina]